MSCNWYDLPCNISALMAWLKSWFDYFLLRYEEFKKFLENLPKKWWKELLDSLAKVLEGIGVPDVVQNAAGALSQIPPSVTWFLDMLAVKECITIILAAYLIRFAIRRIPIIG